ncbi:MAG: ParB/RepB/Spo0J family partition protein [Solirubrobacteraceae bacterium]
MATTTAVDPHRDGDAGDGVQLRHLPLSRIVVPDGFNPRGSIQDDRELEQMAESIRQDGCLQPIRVRATETGDYVLIAGERRYRAAVKAAVMELPAIIRPAGGSDDDEHADLLVEALIENDLRRDLDHLARARGYQRLLDSGLTIKGVAGRLQTTQARVREHLRILKLSKQLQQKVAGDEIPLRAVKSLAQLESIHSGLAAAAAAEILDPEDRYEAYTWADVERAPLDVALAGDKLPEGVYRANTPYPVGAFTLGDRAKRDLAALERMLGRPLGEIRFDAVDLEQARALGAAHGEGWQSIIVGADVADQLAADQLARAVKEMRRRARTQREAVAGHETTTPAPAVGERPEGSEDAERAAQEAERARRVEREAEREAREQATRFNLELGRAVYTMLSRVRVDEQVLKIITSVEIVGELADVAMRGARYCLPGWVTETTQKNGNTKYSYVEKPEAEQRASEYLARAAKSGEIAGRQLALLVLATYADQNAVAISSRSWHHTKASGPWAGEVDELLDKLVRDNLPDSALALLRPVLDKRQQEQRERAAARKAREEATARLDGIEERIGELTIEQVAEVEQDLDGAWTGWTPRYSTLRQLVADRRQQLTGPDNE